MKESLHAEVMRKVVGWACAHGCVQGGAVQSSTAVKCRFLYNVCISFIFACMYPFVSCSSSTRSNVFYVHAIVLVPICLSTPF